jgi:hypothetical protein
VVKDLSFQAKCQTSAIHLEAFHRKAFLSDRPKTFIKRTIHLSINPQDNPSRVKDKATNRRKSGIGFECQIGNPGPMPNGLIEMDRLKTPTCWFDKMRKTRRNANQPDLEQRRQTVAVLTKEHLDGRQLRVRVICARAQLPIFVDCFINISSLAEAPNPKILKNRD